MKQKKPLILIDAFHLYNALTGIKTYSEILLETLSTHEDLQCHYLIYPNWRKASRSSYLKGKLSILRKLIHHGSFFLYKQCYLPLFLYRKSVDAVVSLDFVLPVFKFKKKNFVVIHDVFFWELKENYPETWRIYFTKMVEYGIDNETVIISTSDYTSGKIKEVITNDNRIEKVYQSPKYLPQSADKLALQRLGIVHKQFFLHVGLLDKRKNLLVLLEAFIHFLRAKPDSSMKLVLAGNVGIGKAQDISVKLQQLVTQYNLKNRVILPGFVSDHLLSTLYKSAYAYTFPSLDEGFGIPVLESFQAGTPVIVSNKGALPEIAGDAALVFEGSDPFDLCDKMLQLENQSIREKLIKKGHERIKIFTKERFALDFDQAIYKNLRSSQ